MYSRTLSASLSGLACESTWAEVDTENGIPRFLIVGLANQSVKEASERIHAAVLNCGFKFPAKRIAVNLTPANRKKDGSHYDLPIAVSLLKSTAQLRKVSEEDENGTAYFGELTLDGKLNPVDGILPMAIGLQKEGVKKIVLPAENLKEAELVKGMLLYPASTLREVTDHIKGIAEIKPVKASGFSEPSVWREYPDFSDIKGQDAAKRASQLAAAGMHGMLIIGPPGVGKSMLCKRIPGILPPMSYGEQLELTQIYSVAGELSKARPMALERPFRSPHHSMSAASLAGGGTRPRPGEVSLAHCGLLFLDELPEFSTHALETLRQPLEDGYVSITRVNGRYVFPSRFMLVAAMNPCRCGYYGDPFKQCSCSEGERQRYISKISGPLLDRIDIHLVMERPVYGELSIAGTRRGTTSAELRAGVEKAFKIQKERYRNFGINYNSQLTPKLLGKFCELDSSCESIMKRAFERWSLSARAYHRILRLARTAADLDGCDKIREEHLLEALAYRMPDKYFG